MNRIRLSSFLFCALPVSLVSACATLPDGDDAVALGASAQALIGAPVGPLAGGNDGSMVRNPDGTVSTFGFNDAGQLGDGTTVDRATPARIPGLTGVVAVADGADSYSLALKADGTVVSWGSNLWHQLGAGVSADQHAPVPVVGLTDVTAIAAGSALSLALKADGTVHVWTSNTRGQAGDGTTQERRTPVQVPGLSDIIAISAEVSHALALGADGTVYGWGVNSRGQVGDGSTTDVRAPVAIAGLEDIVAIATGRAYSLALRSDGVVFAWGANAQGQLGDGSTDDALTPVPVIGLAGIEITALASAFQSSYALAADGRVFAWGFNAHGELGDDTTVNRTTPVQVPGLAGITAIAAGDRHALARDSHGAIFAWGLNNHGQLGDGTLTTRKLPVQIILGDDASCLGLFTASGGTAPSGTYPLDPDGAGALPAMATYCDNDFDGGDGSSPGGWTLIESLTGGQGPAMAALGPVQPGTTTALPLAVMRAFAAGATQVHIRTPGEQGTRSITSRAGGSPIISLRTGGLLNVQAEEDQTGNWSGPMADALHLNFTCYPTPGTPGAVWPSVYWAGCNQFGLHIQHAESRWSADPAVNTAFEIYVR